VTDRKKPAAGFWITVALVVVLVGYALSFGPIACIFSADRMPAVVQAPTRKFFAPCTTFYKTGPEPIRRWYEAYILWWTRAGRRHAVTR
jgi:hypothetical protein